jgi:putative DNA primase/helicase
MTQRDFALENHAEAMVKALGGKWQGSFAMCHCPAHDDRTPSLKLTIGDTALLYKCYAGCAQSAILRALPKIGRATKTDSPPNVTRKAKKPHDFKELAISVWNKAVPIKGTRAERYLHGRKIDPHGLDLRFVSRAVCGSGADRSYHPALIAPIRNDRELLAIHRTFLKSDGSIADIDEPKMMLGFALEGVVRWGGVPEDGILRLAEGIEDAASVINLLGFNRTCWPVLGIERYALMAIPESIKHIVIYSQPGIEAAKAIKKAEPHLRANERTLEVKIPPGGGDWNDLLKDIRS